MPVSICYLFGKKTIPIKFLCIIADGHGNCKKNFQREKIYFGA